ncbi:MAG: hypothetical protein HY319_10015 [Armatimonadetes bacterium]|nr:hypothetical protein [Armatimonadota bacterium]
MMVQTVASLAPPVRSAPLPVRADQYRGSVPEHHPVDGADLATYRRVYGACGAAAGSFLSHIAVLGAGAAAGAALASPLGTVAAVAGGLAGAYAGVKLQAKTLVGRQIGGRVGAVLGDAAGRVAHAFGAPLRSDLVEETTGFSYGAMTTALGTTRYTNHPYVDPLEARDFADKLQPGDIVLTNDEACTEFSLLIAAVNGNADFNHALLYAGDGKVLESRTVTDGVAQGDLIEVLSHKHHAIAIRPHYREEEARASVDAGRSLLGRGYDFRFRFGNDALYCSEFVYEALKQGAPSIEFQPRPLLTRSVILPGDFLRTSGADVVAETGTDTSLFNSYLAKFVGKKG